MKILLFLLNEYLNGRCNLAMHSLAKIDQKPVREMLSHFKVSYIVLISGNSRLVFIFGKEEYVKVVESFRHHHFNEFTREEVFILGSLLGYPQQQLCESYLRKPPSKQKYRKQKEQAAV